MPEGDTIWRTAVNLRAAIQDRPVMEAESREHGLSVDSLTGRHVTNTEARGKHLLMHFNHQQVLHSHMGMTGSWHLYPPNEPWKKPARRAAVCLRFEDIVAVCFSPKTLELLSRTALRRHRYLSRLGPDILGGSYDQNEILRRFRIHHRVPIGEALLNQTILCGIGNVYKSEVLFVERISPFVPVAQLEDQTLSQIIVTARELMRKNLEGYPRRTRFGGASHRQWVYNRSGQPCFQCGTPLKMRRQGDMGRSTYWCEVCQPAVFDGTD